MQMKRKRFWIIFSSVVAGIFLLCLCSVMFTRLKTVNVELRTSLGADSNLSENVLDNVKESGEFDYSKSLLFENFNESIDKIEKSNPYVKVEQIVRKFPNKLHVYVSERVPKYRVKDENENSKWYILDVEFKVLETIVGDEDLTSSKLKNETVEVKFLSFTAAHNGDFINKPAEKKYMSQILAGVYGRTKDTTIMYSVDFSSTDNVFYISMKENKSGDYENGCVMEIQGTNNLTEKVFSATCCYCQDNVEQSGEVDLSQKVIIIVEGENGSYSGKMKNQEEQE